MNAAIENKHADIDWSQASVAYFESQSRHCDSKFHFNLKSSIMRCAQKPGVRINLASLDTMSINFLTADHTTVVDAGAAEDIYLMQIPLCGSYQINSGLEQSVSSKYQAIILPSTQPVFLQLDKDCKVLEVAIKRRIIERYFGIGANNSLKKPIVFSAIADGVGRDIVAAVTIIINTIKRGELSSGALESMPLKQAESLFLSLILDCMKTHTQNSLLSLQKPAPRYILEAEKYIRSNIKEEIRVDELAKDLGVSVRKFYTGFKAYLGTTPLKFVKAVRLDKIHDELKNNHGSYDSVTATAMEWGVSHLGRFANEYKEKFGEYPSDTFRFSMAS